MDRNPFHCHRNSTRCRPPAQESARHLCQCDQLVEGARLMRTPTPTSVTSKRSAPRRLSFLFILTLSGCTTFKPPQISYDDDVPPLPDPSALAEDRARPLHIPPSWKPSLGGNKGNEEAK